MRLFKRKPAPLPDEIDMMAVLLMRYEGEELTDAEWDNVIANARNARAELQRRGAYK